MRKNEVAHYPEITKFIEAQLRSNFRAQGMTGVHIFWRTGEFTSKIKELIREHPVECACLEAYSKTTPPLNLDIFGIITDGSHFEIVILEVKRVSAVGLSEWSQLVGYNLVSDAKYGLLINIGAGASERLRGILSLNGDCSKIVRRKADGTEIEHLLGFMQWNTVTQNFEYTNLGQIYSLSALSTELIGRFKMG